MVLAFQIPIFDARLVVSQICRTLKLSNKIFLGIPGTIFNGVCDWVYEEEVISDTRAVWFSPDGKNVAWIEFNDTEVDLMPLEIYGQPGRLEFQYPIPTPLRYQLSFISFNLYSSYVRGLKNLSSSRS